MTGVRDSATTTTPAPLPPSACSKRLAPNSIAPVPIPPSCWPRSRRNSATASGRWCGAGAQNVGRATTVASWRETVHTDAAALADAWRRYFSAFPHPRQRPRLAVRLDWRDRADLFDFTALLRVARPFRSTGTGAGRRARKPGATAMALAAAGRCAGRSGGRRHPGGSARGAARTDRGLRSSLAASRSAKRATPATC